MATQTDVEVQLLEHGRLIRYISPVLIEANLDFLIESRNFWDFSDPGLQFLKILRKGEYATSVNFLNLQLATSEEAGERRSTQLLSTYRHVKMCSVYTFNERFNFKTHKNAQFSNIYEISEFII